jgi:hypothetical protein
LAGNHCDESLAACEHFFEMLDEYEDGKYDSSIALKQSRQIALELNVALERIQRLYTFFLKYRG